MADEQWVFDPQCAKQLGQRRECLVVHEAHGALALRATLLPWSGNWIVARAVRDEISPGLATLGRLVVVLAILLPFAWRGLREELPRLARRDWLVLGALGLTGGGPHLGLQWLGLHYTTAAS